MKPLPWTERFACLASVLAILPFVLILFLLEYFGGVEQWEPEENQYLPEPPTTSK